MSKRIAVLVVIPLLLAAMGFGGRMLMESSFDKLVAYQSPYTTPLPAGQEGEALNLKGTGNVERTPRSGRRPYRPGWATVPLHPFIHGHQYRGLSGDKWGYYQLV